ncbi:hypothetical protein ABK668_24180 [Enterobacter hormaechei]|uniref:hypothetical protein n=1 Tax=Enterobacter hormaechei TaxID=158836 RepID=UPI003752B6C2
MTDLPAIEPAYFDDALASKLTGNNECHFQKATAQNSEAECTTSVNVPIGVGWRGAGSKLNEWSFRLTRSFVATF